MRKSLMDTCFIARGRRSHWPSYNEVATLTCLQLGRSSTWTPVPMVFFSLVHLMRAAVHVQVAADVSSLVGVFV